jgi:prepilin-type N-terminal cleavage/methylation domain-containing protein
MWRRVRDQRCDDGVSIVEIIVAMAIFGLVLAASVPLFMSSVVQTARAGELASASQIANTQLERARSAATTCAGLKAYLDTITVANQGVDPLKTELLDSRGVKYSLTATKSSEVTCPTAGAGLVPFEASVTAKVPGHPVTAQVSSQIWVAS